MKILLDQEHKLPFDQIFREDVYNLLICRNVLKLHNSSLNIVPDEVIPDINMLRLVMEHWILREFNATLIITMNGDRLQLLAK
jgi:hypothetical protein